jgi:toxin ParE1/3/4
VTAVVWTPPAETDLDAIAEYIATDNPEAAARVVRTIRNAAGKLTEFPNRGRYGKSPDTRELVITGYPYLVVYQVLRDGVYVVRVWSQSQERRTKSKH